MKDWRIVELGKVCEFSYGKMPKKEKLVKKGYPVFTGYRIAGYYPNYLFNEKTLIVVARGVGGTGDVKFSPPKCYLTNLSIALLTDDKHIEKKYLYYYFAINKLRYLDSGSAQSQITISDLKHVSISLPPLPEQKAIADTLSCLDDKIELNNMINKNLEEQAQALFKRWFVDFNFPDENGDPYKDSGGEMVESELGLIPNGWTVGYLKGIASIIMGQSPKGSSYNDLGNGTVFYQGRTDFGIRFPTTRLYTTEPSRIAEKGSVLLSVRAPVGDINIAKELCCIGRGLASIKSNSEHNSYIYYVMKNLEKELTVFNSEGTVFGSINKDSINNMKIIVPTKSIIGRYDYVVREFDELIFTYSSNNLILSKCRDSLLPKLMSGKLKINN